MSQGRFVMTCTTKFAKMYPSKCPSKLKRKFAMMFPMRSATKFLSKSLSKFPMRIARMFPNKCPKRGVAKKKSENALTSPAMCLERNASK